MLEDDPTFGAEILDSITSISENTAILSENEHDLINDIVLNYDIESATAEEVDNLLKVFDNLFTMESNIEDNISDSDKADQLEALHSVFDKAAENVEEGDCCSGV